LTIDLFYKKHALVREIVWAFFEGKAYIREKRVNVLMLMLQMNVYYLGMGKGAPFASAQWYAGNSFCSEKTVDRLVKWLKIKGFAKVRRLRRRDTEAGYDNQSWRDLAAEYGPNGPFKLYPEGFYSTNEIDLSVLLAEISKLLGKALTEWVSWWRVFQTEAGVLFKASFPSHLSSDRPPRAPIEAFMPL